MASFFSSKVREKNSPWLPMGKRPWEPPSIRWLTRLRSAASLMCPVSSIGVTIAGMIPLGTNCIIIFSLFALLFLQFGQARLGGIHHHDNVVGPEVEGHPLGDPGLQRFNGHHMDS